MINLKMMVHIPTERNEPTFRKERKSLHYFTADLAVGKKGGGVGEGLQPAMTAATSERGSY
jgi:hypothetical protein